MTTRTSKAGRRNSPSALTGGSKKAGGGRKGRKPVSPVKVGGGRNWGPIILYIVVGAVAIALIGGTFWWQRSNSVAEWEQRASEIEGIIDYRNDSPEVMSEDYRRHRAGPVLYDMEPPVAGPHNETWQNCQADVYDAPIANEHAVHSLEHGAIWITYNPDTLPEDQVEDLAGMVRSGGEKLFMSPYPGLDAPISLQAWGYQLKLEDASDPRIREFIRTLRVNSSLEGRNASCSNGVTNTGTTPVS